MLGELAVVDGCDGAGKTTLLLFMADVLERSKVPVCKTREPGGTPYAEDVREILLRKDPNKDAVAPMTELLLFWACRAQLMKELILPRIARGEKILTDRFTDVTYAYQGTGRGLGEALVAQFEEIVLKGFKPNHVLILDVDPLVGAQRRAARAEKEIPNRLDEEKQSFYEEARQTFLNRSAAHATHSVLDTTSMSRLEVFVAAAKWLVKINWLTPAQAKTHGAAASANQLPEYSMVGTMEDYLSLFDGE